MTLLYELEHSFQYVIYEAGNDTKGIPHWQHSVVQALDS